ncbi:MAG TPA: energy transducer TonB [Verrucomicrobiae bacterium]|jgi:TonB family protein
MNRLEKKCFVFSVGLHGLLAVILLGSAAFRNRTEDAEMPILSMIPANIIDGASSGGGEPAPSMRATPAPPQPQAQPVSKPEVKPVATRPQPQQQPQMIQPEPVRHQDRVKKEEPDEEVHPVVNSENPLPRKPKTHHQHEIHPTFATANPTTSRARVKSESTSDNTAQAAKSAARAEVHRLSAIENSLEHLASGVQSSGAARTVVDVPGISGGGEVFANYRDLVGNYYRQAWIQPDNGVAGSTVPEAKITVARDGTIIKAELVTPSGERALDKSVERALKLVTNLPPFPAASHDEQRTFTIRFSLDLKQATG